MKSGTWEKSPRRMEQGSREGAGIEEEYEAGETNMMQKGAKRDHSSTPGERPAPCQRRGEMAHCSPLKV